MAGDGMYGVTHIHPVGLISVLVLGVALVLLPRQYAVLPMILLACLIPSAQRLVVFGMDFSLLRILIVFAWLRLLLRNEFQAYKWNQLDTLVVAWMASGTVIYTIQYGTSNALVNRLGWAFEGLGMYFSFRCLIRQWKDIECLVLGFVLVSIPVGLAFVAEQLTGRNAFAMFGGVPAQTYIRDGRLRCQGAFDHSILAGCFWVGVMPWMISMTARGRKWIVGAGIVSSITVVVTCASSTPILALAFMSLGLLVYRIRAYVRSLRWGFVIVLILLHLTMQAPVWSLLARVNVVGGSTGWHRYMIVDATINNFSKWWALGEKDPMSWKVFEMRDITNQYILEALRGGLLTLLLFVAAIAVAFKMIGVAIRLSSGNSTRTFSIWCVGVALFVHTSIFFAVSYFGQIVMLLYLTLALAASLPRIIEQEVEVRIAYQPRVETASSRGKAHFAHKLDYKSGAVDL